MKTFILTLLLFGSFAGRSQLNEVSNYIFLQYNGVAGGKVIDKPVYKICISTEQVQWPGVFWGCNYKVDKCTFLAIKNAIEESEAVRQIDTTGVGFYDFKIKSNFKTKLFVAKTSQEVSKMFDQIKVQITNKKLKEDISECLDVSPPFFRATLN